MKLRDFPRDGIIVDGMELVVYFELNEPLEEQVYLDVLADFEDETGKPKRKQLQMQRRCTPAQRRSNAFAYTVKWTPNFALDNELRGCFAKTTYRVRGVSIVSGKMVSVDSQDSHIIMSIDVTRQDALTRIMRHEFSKTDNTGLFDPNELYTDLASLTVQQRKLLVNTALEYPNGRLVTLITLYRRKDLKMNADWSDDGKSGLGVVPNATFSVFHCRNEARSGATPNATSPITLVCHTRYFVVNLKNGPTMDWIQKRVYDRRTPNQWLQKDTDAPVLFKIAAIKPVVGAMSDGVIWNAIHHAASGDNIMPGNSVHGMINTKGCWMLFRNFNWPLQVTNELDRIYRKVYRRKRGKAAMIVELANEKAKYNVAPGTELDGYSSSYDKFLKYDRNWAYQWFFHEIVGIKYFAQVDYWGDMKTANDYNVHGRNMINSFPKKEADRAPANNGDDEADYAYHNVSQPKLPINNNLFRKNVLGFKAASEFVESMDAKLSTAKLASCSWSDVYFFKEDDVKVEDLKVDDVREP